MTTLRNIVDMVGPEFLDVPLQIAISDGFRNSTSAQPPADLWQMPRTLSNPRTGEPGRLVLSVVLTRERLVKVRK